MLPTHALSGMALALPLLAVAPEFTPVAVVAGLLGGIFPDLDMYVGHRKTLHFPVYYSALAVFVAPIAISIPTTATVVLAVFLFAAALHSVSDVFGGGLELRPWEETSNKAVYNHYRGAWIGPRRLIRYDGSPTDLLVSIALAIPLLVALEGSYQWLVTGALVVAIAYTGLRRPLARLAPVVVRALPTSALLYVPDRYVEETGTTAH